MTVVDADFVEVEERLALEVVDTEAAFLEPPVRPNIPE